MAPQRPIDAFNKAASAVCFTFIYVNLVGNVTAEDLQKKSLGAICQTKQEVRHFYSWRVELPLFTF